MHVTSDPAAIDPFHGCVCVPTMGALHDGHTALHSHGALHRRRT